MVLDEIFEVDAAHAYENNHLIAILTKEELTQVKDESEYLGKEINAMREQLSIGQTLQHAFENYSIYEKAQYVTWKAYGLATYAKVRVTCLDPRDCNEIFLKSTGRLPFPVRVSFKDKVEQVGLQSYLASHD